MSNEDLGDSLDSVEALIKKHEDFEKSLAAQEEKIKALDEFATKLIEGQHYSADDVAQRRQSVKISVDIFFLNLTYGVFVMIKYDGLLRKPCSTERISSN